MGLPGKHCVDRGAAFRSKYKKREVASMPIYEYVCCACGTRFSLLQPVGAGESDTVCTACGASVKKVVSSFACVNSSSHSGAGTSFSGGG